MEGGFVILGLGWFWVPLIRLGCFIVGVIAGWFVRYLCSLGCGVELD